MKAWAIAIMTTSQHGIGLCSQFTLAETRGEAVASAVRSVLDEHEAQHGPQCLMGISGSIAYEIAPEVIREAAAQLEPAPG